MLGGVHEKLFPTPEVSTLMIRGMVAVGRFLNCNSETLARFAAEILRTFCIFGARVINALVAEGSGRGRGVPFALVSTRLAAQLAISADCALRVPNALVKLMSPD